MGKRLVLALVMVFAVGCNDNDGDSNSLSPGGDSLNVSANGASMANADGSCSQAFENAILNMSDFAVGKHEQLTNLEQQVNSGTISEEQAETAAEQVLGELENACDQLTSEWGTGTCQMTADNGQAFEFGTDMLCGGWEN